MKVDASTSASANADNHIKNIYSNNTNKNKSKANYDGIGLIKQKYW